MNSKSQNIISLFFFAIIFFAASSLFGQSGQSAKNEDKVITLTVPGVCGNCKERIESTAMDVAGVKKAEWDIQTDTLVLVGSSKMDPQKVANALAKAGYRSDLAKADPKGYKKLPACCQYDHVEKH